MKAKLFIAMVLLAGCMASCVESNQPERVYPNTAGHDIAGTYNGTWTITDGEGESREAKGSIVFTETDEAYIATIAITIEGGGNRGDVCNVSHANGGFVFYNNVGSAFGTKFVGAIDESGHISMQYSLEERQGFTRVIQNYVFSGAR